MFLIDNGKAADGAPIRSPVIRADGMAPENVVSHPRTIGGLRDAAGNEKFARPNPEAGEELRTGMSRYALTCETGALPVVSRHRRE